jgi:hypothetical protein
MGNPSDYDVDCNRKVSQILRYWAQFGNSPSLDGS